MCRVLRAPGAPELTVDGGPRVVPFVAPTARTIFAPLMIFGAHELRPGSGGAHGRLHPRMASVLTDCGFNVASVAGNHAMDWGRRRCWTRSTSAYQGRPDHRRRAESCRGAAARDNRMQGAARRDAGLLLGPARKAMPPVPTPRGWRRCGPTPGKPDRRSVRLRSSAGLAPPGRDVRTDGDHRGVCYRRPPLGGDGFEPSVPRPR